MTIKENVTLYKCGYCKKTMQRKHAMERHEKYCYARAENQSICNGCIHLEEIKVQYTHYMADEYDNEIIKTTKGFHCKKLDKLMYHIGAERKGLVQKYPETFEGRERMPSFCESFSFGNEFMDY